jgi:hypothetical protein
MGASIAARVLGKDGETSRADMEFDGDSGKSTRVSIIFFIIFGKVRRAGTKREF